MLLCWPTLAFGVLLFHSGAFFVPCQCKLLMVLSWQMKPSWDHQISLHTHFQTDSKWKQLWVATDLGWNPTSKQHFILALLLWVWKCAQKRFPSPSLAVIAWPASASSINSLTITTSTTTKTTFCCLSMANFSSKEKLQRTKDTLVTSALQVQL